MGAGLSLTPAILLIGPTASGKTPLGDALAKVGFRGRLCAHFDFGAQLRAVAEFFDSSLSLRERAGVRGYGLTAAELAVIDHSLRTGALLEEKDADIARKLLRGFIEAELSNGGWVVLNGLPRHIGQTAWVAESVEIKIVVQLACSAAVIHERVQRDTGGDRAERVDDSPAEIANKLAIFEARTRPLVDHYRAAGAEVITVDVGVNTRAEDVVKQLNRQ